jgi:hypothetical protein
MRRAVILLGCFLTLAPLVASPAARGQVTVPGQSDPAYPRAGTVTGTEVYVRCGPGSYYYPVSRVHEGTTVTVLGREPGWTAIEPPEGVWGLIRRGDVSIGEDGTTGTVSATSTRVYASGTEVSEHGRTWCVMARLNEGDTVKLTGEMQGQMLRVQPPEGARVYVSAEYVAVQEQPAPTPPTPPTPPVPSDGDPETFVGPEAAVSPPPVPPAELSSLLEQFKDAEDALAREIDKPLEERDYDALIATFAELQDQAEADWLKQRAAKRIAMLKALLARREKYEESLRLKNELQNALTQIEQDRKAAGEAAEKRRQMEPFDAVGTVGRLQFAEGDVASPIRYKLTDEAGRISVVLRSDELDLDEYEGETVGVYGKRSYVKQWRIHLIDVEKIVPIE